MLNDVALVFIRQPTWSWCVPWHAHERRRSTGDRPTTTISFHAIEREILRRRREREAQERERGALNRLAAKKELRTQSRFYPLGRFRMSNVHFYVVEPCPIPMCTRFGMSSLPAIDLVKQKEATITKLIPIAHVHKGQH